MDASSPAVALPEMERANLPHVHGLDVCRQIKQDNQDTIVVVFSATNDPDIRQRSLEAGASAFVYKGTGDLLSTVKSLYGARG